MPRSERVATSRTQPSRSWRGILARLAIVLPAIYIVWCIGLYLGQDVLIFRTGSTNTRPAWPEDAPYRSTIEITTPQGFRIPALLLRPAGDPTGSIKRPAAMIFHGNSDAAARAELWPETQALLNMGFVVMVPEYRGYYPAQGTPSQAAITDDMRAFRAMLDQTPGVDPDRVIYVGRSLGTGVACDLARSHSVPPRGLVLIAPFISLRSMASGFGVPGFIVRHPYRNDEVLAQLDVPVLLVHGAGDVVIPSSHSQHLASLAKRGTLMIDDGDHNSTPIDDATFSLQLRDWLASAGIDLKN